MTVILERKQIRRFEQQWKILSVEQDSQGFWCLRIMSFNEKRTVIIATIQQHVGWKRVFLNVSLKLAKEDSDVTVFFARTRALFPTRSDCSFADVHATF